MIYGGRAETLFEFLFYFYQLLNISLKNVDCCTNMVKKRTLFLNYNL